MRLRLSTRLREARAAAAFWRRGGRSAEALHAGLVLIEGFPSSAAGLLAAAVHPREIARVRSRVGRPWILEEGLAGGAVVVLVLRAPRETVLALGRSPSDAAAAGVPSIPAFALLAWIGYHRRVRRLAGRVILAPLESLLGDPAESLRRLAQAARLDLQDQLVYQPRGLPEGPKAPLRLGLAGSLLLGWAERLHGELFAAAIRQGVFFGPGGADPPERAARGLATMA